MNGFLTLSAGIIPHSIIALISHYMLTGRIYISCPTWMCYYLDCIIYCIIHITNTLCNRFIFFNSISFISLQRLQGDLERSAAINRGLASRVAQCSLNGLADFLYRWEHSSWHICCNCARCFLLVYLIRPGDGDEEKQLFQNRFLFVLLYVFVLLQDTCISHY